MVSLRRRRFRHDPLPGFLKVFPEMFEICDVEWAESNLRYSLSQDLSKLG